MLIIAHISTMLRYSPIMNSRYGVERVFDLVAGHEFGFRFRQIERRAVGLRQRRDEEDHHHREHGDADEDVVREFARS